MSVNDGRVNPFDTISDEKIIDWCNVNRVHIPTILAHITPTRLNSNKSEWRTAVLRLLEITQNLSESLRSLRHSVASFHWGDGSGAVLADRLALLKALEENPKEEVRNWAKVTQAELVEQVKNFQAYESQRHQARNETFE